MLQGKSNSKSLIEKENPSKFISIFFAPDFFADERPNPVLLECLEKENFFSWEASLLFKG